MPIQGQKFSPLALPGRAGLGLKAEHYRDVAEGAPDIGWFEVHPENYMGEGGPPHAWLSRIRQNYPLSLHGVGLSLGGAARPDKRHLERLRTLIQRYQPQSFSEHLAWSTHEGQFFNDLLPLPYTMQTAASVCDHVDEVQQALGMKLLLENPAVYLSFASSDMDEIDFLTLVARRSGCGLLLDVNNVYVSATNRDDDPSVYIEQFPHELVGEIHLAGHALAQDQDAGRVLIDSHDCPVSEVVFALYERTLTIAGAKPTLIERDGNIPPLPELLAEAARVDRLLLAAGVATRHEAGEVHNALA